jgi:hypothetical protein
MAYDKLMMQVPIDHLQQLEEMICTAEALPAGDMQSSNKALQLEWFYMSFHAKDQAKYAKSGQRLSSEMLESVAEDFANVFNLQVADSSLAKKRKHQIEQCMRLEMRRELCKRFNEKVRCATEQRYGGDSHHNRQGNRHHHHDSTWQDCNESSCRSNYDKHKKKQEDKTPSDQGDKVFKPCSMHRPKSKHTSE